MSEVLVEFADVVSSRDGVAYAARACGGEGANGLWQGWIEFIPVGGGEPVRSGRETTQPNRQDAVYWATGLTPVYLEGALTRALNPITRLSPAPAPAPIFDGPAPDVVAEGAQIESVLNPFSVYRKGEALLRSQLGALSAWHLVNIIRAYALSDEDPAVLNSMAPGVLAEIIVAAVRAHNAQPSAP